MPKRTSKKGSPAASAFAVDDGAVETLRKAAANGKLVAVIATGVSPAS